MSNTSSNDRGGQRPARPPQSTLSLGQIGRDDAPLLIPIQPSSSIDEITTLVRQAGVSRVELLVPDGTTALQSIAGNETLREAAKAVGTRVTIFTSDEKTTHAARFAKLDVVSVGGTVAAPRPGETPRRPTGQRSAAQRAAPTPPAVQPRPPAQAETALPPARPSTPQRPATAAPAAVDADFLSQLEAFDQAPPPQPARTQQSDEGALLFDVPGDIGVQRPAEDDAEWQAAFGELDTTMSDDVLEPAPQPRSRRRQRSASPVPPPDQRAPRPSLLGALVGVLPQRTRRVPQETPPADDGMRMARPERTPEEVAVRRRQSRSLMLWPIALISVVLIGVALIAYSMGTTGNSRSFLSAVLAPFSRQSAPIQLVPPLSGAESETFTNQVIPLVTQPVTEADSINVQGLLLTAPVTVTLQGTAASSTVAPIGYAQGTVTLRNRSSQAVTIPGGTTVPAGGQEFVVETDVTVPGSVASEAGITFGVADATLRARTPGGSGNIPLGTITSIPGYTGNQGPLAVAQPAPFSGGSDQQVQIVSPDDVSKLLPEGLTQLYAKGAQSLLGQVQPGFALVQSESTPAITPTQELLKNIQPSNYAAFPPVGQVTQDGRFTLQLFQTFAALASPQNEPIDQQLARAVKVLVVQSRPELANADVQVTGWRRGEQGLVVDAVFTPRGSYQPIPSDQLAQIQQALAGRSRAEAEAYLQQLVNDGVISGFQLPENLDTLPSEPTLEVETAESNQ